MLVDHATAPRAEGSSSRNRTGGNDQRLRRRYQWSAILFLGIVFVILKEAREMTSDSFNVRGGNISHHGNGEPLVQPSLDGTTTPVGLSDLPKNVSGKLTLGRRYKGRDVTIRVDPSLPMPSQKVLLLSSAGPPPPPRQQDSDSEVAVKLRYLSLVYSEEVRNSSLFDDLEMIYRNSSTSLPLHMIPCKVFVYGHECRKFWKRKCVTHGRRVSGLDLTLIAERYLPTRKTIVGDRQWLEVTRWGMPEGNGYGCFFNVRKGSGVFVNVQKSLVVQDDDDAKKMFKAADTRAANYCPHARRLGYDSVQIVNSIDGRSNQLILCKGSCETEKVESACVPGLELRTGMNHDKPCECDGSYPLLNCGNAISPRGSPHICDQNWGYNE